MIEIDNTVFTYMFLWKPNPLYFIIILPLSFMMNSRSSKEINCLEVRKILINDASLSFKLVIELLNLFKDHNC